MTTEPLSEHEAQRRKHLVFGAARPKPPNRKRRKGAQPPRLAPGIEEAVAVREAWSHKAEGTPETHAKADREGKREGAIARLHRTGTIDAHQLAAVEAIRTAHAAVTAEVAVRTAKLETRGSANKAAVEDEAPRAVRLQLAYTRWREQLGADAALVLAIVVDDVGVVEAGRRWRRSTRTATRILVQALDRWIRG